MTKKKVLSIGLTWHSLNSSNLGIGALTVSDIEIIQDAAESAGRPVRFHIICWRAEEGFHQELDLPVEIHYMRAKDFIRPFSPLRRWIKQCDVIFDIGAGDSFADFYGYKRFFFLAMTKIFTLLYRKPLVLAPQTLGPFVNPMSRTLAAWLMKRSALVYARDKLSFDYARSLGVTKNLHLTTDVAFRLPYDQNPDGSPNQVTADNEDKKAAPTRIGFNVSALLYRKALSKADHITLSLDYVRLVHRIIERLLSEANVSIVLVPHVIADHLEYENDLDVSQEIAQRYPGVTVSPRFSGASEAKTQIHKLDLLIGSRMHATIAAASSGVPILPLSYSRKFTGLYHSLDYPHVCDLTADSEQRILDQLDYLLSHREEAKRQIAASAERAERLLSRYQDSVRTLLKTL